MRSLVVMYNISLPLSICTQDTSNVQAFEKIIPAEIKFDNRIYLDPFVSIEDIYLDQHNTNIGKTWDQHNLYFSNFIKETKPESIFEIAGGNGFLYKKYNTKIPWIIVDLNPTIVSKDNLIVLKKNFEFSDIKNNNTIICSHFFEHITDHKKFLQQLRESGIDNFIVSIPNMGEYLKSNFPALHFEHPVFLSESYMEYICSSNGWLIVKKAKYKNHSIFYQLQSSSKKFKPVYYDIETDLNFLDNFFQYYLKRIEKLKNNQFYIFGAHFPLYYLLSLGLDKKNILGVVDNDIKKQNKRMYGLDIQTYCPKSIPSGSNICVEMGPYNIEIKKNLKNHVLI